MITLFYIYFILLLIKLLITKLHVNLSRKVTKNSLIEIRATKMLNSIDQLIKSPPISPSRIRGSINVYSTKGIRGHVRGSKASPTSTKRLAQSDRKDKTDSVNSANISTDSVSYNDTLKKARNTGNKRMQAHFDKEVDKTPLKIISTGKTKTHDTLRIGEDM